MSLRMTLLFQAAQLYWRIFKPVTLGVRALLVKDEHVLLIRHSYQPGWFMPGGGVKKQEDLETAVRRECQEEVGGILHNVSLFGVYSHISEKKNDHVIVMLSTNFDYSGRSDKEIVAVQLFPLSQLPADLAPGTKNRIEEYLSREKRPFMGQW